jgi:hypothetical protein
MHDAGGRQHAPAGREHPARWRTSSFSGGQCVAVAEVGGAIALRNSNHPDAGTLLFTPAGMAAWIRSARAGELDDLA